MTDRYIFFIIIAVVTGLTIAITSCSYQEGSCKKEAIKANINPEHIKSACRIT